MIIDKSKTYRTRDGREVRIYAVGQASPFNVHGAVGKGSFWWPKSWTDDGEAVGLNETFSDGLIPADPHGILPRHRELLAEAMEEHKHDFGEWAKIVRTGTFASLTPSQHVALIAVARLDAEKAK